MTLAHPAPHASQHPGHPAPSRTGAKLPGNTGSPAASRSAAKLPSPLNSGGAAPSRPVAKQQQQQQQQQQKQPETLGDDSWRARQQETPSNRRVKPTEGTGESAGVSGGATPSRPVPKQQQQQQQKQQQQQQAIQKLTGPIPSAAKPGLPKSGGPAPSRPGAKLPGLNNGSHSPAARHHPKLGIISGAAPDSGDED